MYINNHGQLVHDEYLSHHGILGQKWGKMNGPPYPLGAGDHSSAEKKAGWKRSLSGSRNEELYERNIKKSDKQSSRSVKSIKQSDRDKHPNNSSASYDKMVKTLEKADNENVKAHKLHDEIIKEAKRTGKSAAEVENENKYGGIKKALKIGAAVAGAALVAYGAYRLYDIYNNHGKELGLDKIVNNGNSNFLSKAFKGKSYIAVDSSWASKDSIDKLLTKPAGEWWKGLSKSEKKSMELYSENYYDLMNKLLWTKKGAPLGDTNVAKVTQNALNALDKASLPADMVVTHGVDLDKACSFLKCTKEELYSAATGKQGISKLLGQVNTNHGFVSTTSTASGGGFVGAVKYKILLPKGAKAAYLEHISSYGDLPHPPPWNGKSTGKMHSLEFETLIQAGSKFKTNAIQYNKNGFIEVALEYLPEAVKSSSLGNIAGKVSSLYNQGMTYAQIADNLGISTSSVSNYLNS